MFPLDLLFTPLLMPSFDDWSWSSGKIVVIRRMNSAATAWRPLLQVALAIWNINSRLRHRRIHTEELKQQLATPPGFFLLDKKTNLNKAGTFTTQAYLPKRNTFPQQKVKVLPAMLSLTIQAKTIKNPFSNEPSQSSSVFHLPARSQRLRFRTGSSSCSFVRSEDWHFFLLVFWVRILSVKKIQAA